MMTWRVGAAATLAAVAVAIFSEAAMAHPLGNFTINRYSGITLSGADLRVHYVVDLAEIPTYQERHDIGAGKTYPDDNAYLDRKVAELAKNLVVEVDGRAVALHTADRSLSFPAGQGGLDTMRIELLFTAPALSPGSRSLAYQDGNYPGRLGWKEITARASGGAQLRGSTVPTNSISNELRSYPQDQLTSPLAVTRASMTLVPGVGGRALPPFLDKAGGGFRAVQDRYTELVAAQDLTPIAITLSVLLAAALGAAHAFSPGHGKAVMAAYLVGTRRSSRHAAILGSTITATHTIGVFALGAVTLLASAIVTPERLYPYLTLASGLMVATLGITLVVSRTRLALAAGSTPRHPHSHGSHSGTGEHTHKPPQTGAGMGALIALGISGGLLPCPSALIVMLSAITIHRVAFGMVLVVAFSLGLALMLTVIGVALAAGAPLLNRLPWRDKLPSGLLVARLVSVGAALVITIVGIAVTLEAVPTL